jgi:ComF family protein
MCRLEPRSFRKARAAFPYVASVRECLHALKYAGRRRIASTLGRLASGSLLSGDLDRASAVIPVPLSRRRQRERGFNQAELVARAVSRETGIRLVRRALAKTSERPPQAGLSAAARRKNAAGAYRARLPASLRGKAVLLVDDVMTTGATADAAARALLRGGARAVDVLTLARVP